jgi:circadian clock protein KaiC
MIESDLVRLKTGIPGLDEMVEGGFPFPSVILVAGTTGTGKTTFAQKFLFSGADNGEQGLFFTTLSESTQWMLRFATRFKFIKKEYLGNLVKYVELGPILRDISAKDLLEFIDGKIAEVMPQRIVIDPVTVIGTMLKDAYRGYEYRRFLFDLTTRLKNWQAITVLTGEINPAEPYPPEIAYAVDGLILLQFSEEGEARRKYIEVLKMRGTNHLTGRQSIDITTEDGIVVLRAKF